MPRLPKSNRQDAPVEQQTAVIELKDGSTMDANDAFMTFQTWSRIYNHAPNGATIVDEAHRIAKRELPLDKTRLSESTVKALFSRFGRYLTADKTDLAPDMRRILLLSCVFDESSGNIKDIAPPWKKTAANTLQLQRIGIELQRVDDEVWEMVTGKKARRWERN